MPNSSRRAVLVLIDGARCDVLRELLGRGDLPNLARWVIEPGGLSTGTTVFPSTTGVAYIPFLFGRYPGSVGIPGIRWLDRSGGAGAWRAQWRAARSYCGVQAGWLNSDIAPAPSLFDLVPESIAICTPLIRGLRPGANRLIFRRAVLGSAAHYVGTYPALDRAVARSWLDAAGESWRFLFVVFPGVDGISHLKDPWHPAVLESYRFVDRVLALPAVRLAACRADAGGVVVRTQNGVALLTETSGLIRYQPESGDPLRLGGYAELDDRQLLSRTRDSDVPDAPRQLLQLFQTPRAGDLVLAAAPGADFRGPWEIPEHRAGHGSLIAEHMEVPIAASVALPDAPIRTVDLMPTILERLDVTVPSGVVLDGVPFSKIAAAAEQLVR